MSRIVALSALLFTISGMPAFAQCSSYPYSLTNGTTANATEVIATYTFEQAFTQNRVGYAATLSLVMTLISLVASVTFIRLRERGEG